MASMNGFPMLLALEKIEDEYLLFGAAGLIAVVFERMRYGSEAVGRSSGASADAGLDNGPRDPRFHPTDERFTDPTTGQRVRVWVDPATGERRYRPDE